MDTHDADKMPTVDIEKYLSDLRKMRPITEAERGGPPADPRNAQIAQPFSDMAHAIADFINEARIAGFSAGEAIVTIHSVLLPLEDVPVISTT